MDILVDCCVLMLFGRGHAAELEPISSQAEIKATHLLVDKLISTKYDCHSSIPLVAACSRKEIGWSWLGSFPL